jgi:type I restriction enzyme S subunit
VTTSGGTPSRERQDFFGGDIPWVKSGELASGRVDTTEESITLEALASSSAKLMPPGTLLLAMYGATVGAVATLGIEAATNQAICCIAPTEELTERYVAGFLRTKKNELISKAAGGAQPNISQSIIRDLDIPLPPVPTQNEYSARVGEIDAVAHKIASSEVMVNELFGSLQQRAFRGEL